MSREEKFRFDVENIRKDLAMNNVICRRIRHTTFKRLLQW